MFFLTALALLSPQVTYALRQGRIFLGGGLTGFAPPSKISEKCSKLCPDMNICNVFRKVQCTVHIYPPATDSVR